MNFFVNNITFLREKLGLKKTNMATAIGFPRTTWDSYELGKAEPDIDRILVIADFFGVSVVDLLQIDLSNPDLNEKTEIVKNSPHPDLNPDPLPDLKGKKKPLPVKPVEANSDNDNEKNNVYDLDSFAAAGIALFVSERDRRKTKPTLHFPWLGPGVHIRIAVGGDSMHPTIKDQDKTIATWVDDIGNLRQGMVYIILDKDEGLVCKRIYRHHTKNTLEFISDNDLYKPYTRHLQDILAIFRIVEVTTTDLRPEMSEFKRELRQMRQELNQIQLILPKG